ncbi:1,4-alpha-glucan branching protein [Nonomuraea fastidiosa]|uniref:maltokinase N-terminal cap-like domain-containing protein n=1 Tax=Nonomuraea TaxID=83681 RepID=UPI00325203B9
MAVIHRTTMKPTKLELLTPWLPTRPWYRGGPARPELVRAGGFRLDDPEGEVGIEFMVLNDVSGGAATTYLVPLTYRGAALDGAEHALLGTAEHGVLGRRWIYDGCHDPVLITQLTAFVAGRVQAQAQNVSDTPDPTVTRAYTAPAAQGTAARGTADSADDADDAEGTTLPGPPGTTLRLHRVLQVAAPLPKDAIGHVSGVWDDPDGTQVRGIFVTVHPHT